VRRNKKRAGVVQYKEEDDNDEVEKEEEDSDEELPEKWNTRSTADPLNLWVQPARLEVRRHFFSNRVVED
jgi:hypothetical protein